MLGKLVSASMAASALWCGASGAAQTVAVKADVLYTVSSSPIRNGVVLIRDGKIVAAGAGVAVPGGTRTIHARAVMPGMIDAHSYLGCWNEIEEQVDAVTPDLRACDAFDPQATALRTALRAGVTTVCVMPGNGNALAGQAAVIRLGITPQILNRYAAQKLSISVDAASGQRYPTSRAGAVAVVRAALTAATAGGATSSTQQSRLLTGDIATSLDARPAALRPVLAGRVPAFIHAPTADDADIALRLAAEFKLRPVLLHANGAADSLEPARARGLGVIVGPLRGGDSPRVLANAGRLARLGAKVAFCTDAPLTDPGSLRMSASLAVKNGLDPQAALRGLTLTAAELLGIADRVGSIQPGKAGDLVLLDGDPLDLSSRVTAVFSAGSLVYGAGAR